MLRAGGEEEGKRGETHTKMTINTRAPGTAARLSMRRSRTPPNSVLAAAG